MVQENIKYYVSERKRFKEHSMCTEKYRGLPLYACEVLVDDESSVNETIRQRTTKCCRTKWMHSVLSPEMFFKFL